MNVIAVFVAVVALVLAMAAQLLIYRRYAYKNVEYTCAFDTREVYENETFMLTEQLKNAKILPLPWIKFELDIHNTIVFGMDSQERSCVLSFFMCKGYRNVTRSWQLRALRRGAYRYEKVESSTSDILGLTRLFKTFPVQERLLVLPSGLLSNEDIALVSSINGEYIINSSCFYDPMLVNKILPYTGNEPFNKINWKSTAKSQQLMVNSDQPSYRNYGTILLDLPSITRIRTERIPEHLMERCIRIAATARTLFGDDCELRIITSGALDYETDEDFISDTGIGEFINTAKCGLTVAGWFNPYDSQRSFLRTLALLKGNEKVLRPFGEIVMENIDLLQSGGNTVLISYRMDDSTSELYHHLRQNGIPVIMLTPISDREFPPEAIAV